MTFIHPSLVMSILISWSRCLIFLLYSYFFLLQLINNLGGILRPHEYVALHQNFPVDLVFIDDFCLTGVSYDGSKLFQLLLDPQSLSWLGVSLGPAHCIPNRPLIQQDLRASLSVLWKPLSQCTEIQFKLPRSKSHLASKTSIYSLMKRRCTMALVLM